MLGALPLMIGWNLGRLGEGRLPFPGQPVELHHLWGVLVSGSLEVLQRPKSFFLAILLLLTTTHHEFAQPHVEMSEHSRTKIAC